MNAAAVLDSIRNLDVLVVGDVCLDRWCYYDPAASEPSRETGIPRIAVVRTEVTPGAAGTITNNLVALGVRKIGVIGVVGQDGFGSELLRALNTRQVAPDFLVVSPDVPTFTYTKLINRQTGVEDLPRVDFISEHAMPREAEDKIVDKLEQAFDLFGVVIVCDQAETETGGVVTAAVRAKLMELAELHPDRVVWVDSRVRAELFRHVVLKPNDSEAEAACQRKFGQVDLQRLFTENQLRSMFVTHGGRGVEVWSDGGHHWVPGRIVDAVDICGAGDSFSAGAACALAVTGSTVDAAMFGNLVASITVTKMGTGTASPEEVIAASRSV